MPRIVTVHVTKTVRRRRVLDDVSLTFEGGRIYGLVGPNGSGKTMLLRALSGLIFPDRGQIIIDGRRLHRDISFPPSVGVMIENTQLLPGFTAFENLRLLSKLKGVADEEAIRSALSAVGLDPDSRLRVRAFSLGQKQRLAIAQAVFEDPDILLLDEPTNALDDQGAARLRALLFDARRRGKLTVLASHSREDISALCDQVIRVSEDRFTP